VTLRAPPLAAAVHAAVAQLGHRVRKHCAEVAQGAGLRRGTEAGNVCNLHLDSQDVGAQAGRELSGDLDGSRRSLVAGNDQNPRERAFPSAGIGS
jgi:hypothetical protein